MEFRRLGHVFVPSGGESWAQSHASTPFAMRRPDGLVDVLYSSRDSSNRSHIGSVTLRWHESLQTPIGAPRLLLSPGPPGAFDEHGASMGSVIEMDGAAYLYYVGWSLRTEVPWQNTIGLAIRERGDTEFRKVGTGPVLGTSGIDPHSMSYPWVIASDGQLVMWYGTNLSWGPTPADMEHSIRRAVSRDGIHWVPDSEVSVDVDRPDEYALARPSVWRNGATWYMLLSRRTRSRPNSYDFTLARSPDGVHWQRSDHLLDQGHSIEPWDSEMACYAAAFDCEGDVCAVYCGNGFGRTGFGAARLESSTINQ